MKKISLLLMATGLFAVSCSSNDDGGTGPDGAAFLPLDAANYWVYDVSGTQTSGRDSLYVANDTVINTITYKKLKTANASNGFYSGALSGNAIRQIGTKLRLTGSTSFAFSEDFPVSFGVTDFTFFDSAAPAGTELGIATGAFEQPTEDGYTISIEYSLSATAGGEIASYTAPNGTAYTNVKTANMALQLTITAFFDLGGFEIPVEVLPHQNVLTSTQYYAEGIGAVYVSTDLEYELTDLSGFDIELPIPSTGTEHIDEVLDVYSVE